jgi:hypothetical protein
VSACTLRHPSREPRIATPTAFPPRPLFIFGCPRSGTSVLTLMLARHPGIAIPYESHLYNRVYPLVRRYGEPTDAAGWARLAAELLRTDYIRQWSPPPTLPDTLAAMRRQGFAGMVEGILAGWTARQGKARWGEKTPQHTLWWREIREGFPDMQVIHVVRDGRDVALSYRAAHFGPKHVYDLAQRWVVYLGAAEEAGRALGETGFLVVRYEDLLRGPEEELRRICGFLGEAFDPAMLEQGGSAVSYPTDPRNEANLRRPLITGNAGKWSTAMTPREIRIFEALAGPALERYGYPRAAPGAAVSRWEAWSSRFVEHPPRRLAAIVRNRQGHRLLLEKLRLGLLFRLGRLGP